MTYTKNITQEEINWLEDMLIELGTMPDLVEIHFGTRNTSYTGAHSRETDGSDVILDKSFYPKVKLRIIDQDSFGTVANCTEEAKRMVGELKEYLLHQALSPDFQTRIQAAVRLRKNFPDLLIPRYALGKESDQQE